MHVEDYCWESEIEERYRESLEKNQGHLQYWNYLLALHYSMISHGIKDPSYQRKMAYVSKRKRETLEALNFFNQN